MKILEKPTVTPPRTVTCAGVEFPVVVSVLTLKRVREGVDGVDLSRVMLDQAKYEELFGDPVKLAGTLFVIGREPIEAAGMNAERFLERITTDELSAATGVLMRALADFLPNPKVRAAVHEIIDEGEREAEKALSEAVASLIPTTDDEPAPEPAHATDEAPSNP